MCRFHRVPWLLPALALALDGESASAQTIKLSAPLVQPIGGAVEDYVLSPDERHLVFVADAETDDLFELFVTQPSGGPRIKLNARLPAFGDVVGEILVTPDGQRVVYRADQERDKFVELYSVPIGGGLPTKLSGGLEVAWDFHSTLALSPDGESVLFQGFDASSNVYRELYGAPVDGSAAPRKLSGSLVEDGDVTGFRVSLDGRWCVYRADQDTNDQVELYSVPLDGSAPARKINGLLVPPGDVEVFAIDPRSRRVVYRADQEANDRFELYSALIDGRGEPSKLNSPLVNRGDVMPDFRIDAEGTRVLFLAQQQNGVPAIYGPTELYSAPLDGGQPPTKLNSRPGNRFNAVLGYSLAPDGKRAIYRASFIRPGTSESVSLLFSVPTDGSRRAVRISDVPVYGSGVGHSFEIDPLGRNVVYLDQDPAGLTELHSVPIDGSADPIELGRLSSRIRPFDPVLLRISPDAKHVVYHDRIGRFGPEQLRSVPLDGSRPPALVGEVSDDSDDSEPLLFAAVGRIVVHRAPGEAGGLALVRVPIDGSRPPVELSGPLPLGPVAGDVEQFSVSPDGKHVVYYADQEVDEMFELFSVRLDGGSEPVKLNDPLLQSPDVRSSLIRWRITGDGSRAVFVVHQKEEYRFHSVPIDRSSGPIDLSDAISSRLLDYDLTPDGRHLVYRAAREVDHAVELFSVPVDGSARPLKLNGPLANGGDVASFGFGSGGNRVVYVADQDVDGVQEIFSIPVTGGVAPVKLNPPFVAGISHRLAIAPGGNRVVYSADQDGDGSSELYSVPIDGIAGALNLTPAFGPRSVTQVRIGAGGKVVFLAEDSANEAFYFVPISGAASPVRVSAFLTPRTRRTALIEFGPDGKRVMYAAHDQTSRDLELFSVLTDGSTELAHLSGPPVDGSVDEGAGGIPEPGRIPSISPDGMRVVYRARSTQGAELYSAPFDGSSPAVKLSPPFQPATALQNFRIARDSSSVLYRFSLDAQGWDEDQSALMLSPIDGSRPPALIVAPPRTLGSQGVQAFETTLDGTRVVYTADLDFPTVKELFLTVLPSSL